jgi:Flp pilus assembly protein TadD/DNA-binding transcriptional MerR regulator
MAAVAGSGYSFGAAAAILGVSESRLRYWSQIGFVGPSLRQGGKQVYSFQDLASVKAARELQERGLSTAEIRRCLERIRSQLPDIDRPLEHLRVAFDGKELVLLEEGGPITLLGQRVFDFGLGELRTRASGWGRTTPAPPEDAVSVTTSGSADPTTPYAWFQEGLRCESEGREDGAAAAYRRALDLDPGLAAAHTNLGALAHRRGDTAEAIACFQAALALDPDQPEARYDLAHVLIEAGELELASAELRRVLQIVPESPDAHFNLGIALEALGSRKQAREHLCRYLDLAGPSALTEPWASAARARLQRLAP